jgi:putative transposase
MSHPLRLQYPGTLYHVTPRGTARQAIYPAPADYTLWLAVFASVLERAPWRCYAYGLMTNPYHLLIETPAGNLSLGMRQLNGLYPQRFNRRHGRVGHLFQGRFKASVVDRESYLLELCRYVVLTPVRAGMVKRPAQYRWSSYRAMAGLAPAPAWLNRAWVLAQFSPRPARAEQLDRHFVEEGITATASPWEQVRGQIVLGPEPVVEQLTPRLTGSAQATAIPQSQRGLARPTLATLFSNPQQTIGLQRNQTIRAAHLQHGYSLTAIGRQLGLHYSTISKIVQYEGEQQYS